ncbi:DUF1642 domain-containing protein [Enterococcus durans]|uniref:DUF1642 domain-containing protein n=1 Tax=Enterococcus durans TaxID=53345 RepID=UPI00101ECA29|nr:DUF1642 domain-containing protein [Enterococcus durans]MZG91107.1 DUF1642 domain-containing protein [Enterococcus durans]MZG93833.1 DUF1642 domain-containing protein [Enterococcus durans]MZH20787.1 DUF1642 domain-containing protein [Enterococcus durans]MZH23520.1 DUF1642 domain-containing protein [Enterococcus durans]MZH26227.1 DUF1642 domain-containing protein [Enterococcus durans]
MLTIKKGQTYICTKSDKRWWTVGKEYPVFLNSYNEPAIRDDDGDDWHSSYLSISNNQFKLKEEQPKVTLDEPQKPVVPKFVAEWFEDNKDDLEFAIWELCVDSYGSAQQGMLDWIQQSENKPIETLVRMKDGYEVEKEPLYSVIIAGEYLVKEISCSNEVKLVSTAYLPQYLAHHYQLTEKQIKEIDERYWPFAVPVEEVVEG